MADNKHNQDQSWNNNDQEQNRSRQQWDRNQRQENTSTEYGNSGYENRSMHSDRRPYGNTGYSGSDIRNEDYNRVNHTADHNEHRTGNRNYGNQQYGTYGSSASDRGAYSSDHGYQQGTGSSYNSEDYNQRYRNQEQGNQGNYGNNYQGESRGRTNVTSWNNEQRNRNYDDYGNNYSGAGYGGSDNRRREAGHNMYGGDTSNYGNANQGSFDRGWWDRTRDQVKSWFGDDDAERRRQADRKVSYRGKGPKDYQRSQDRIREDVCDRLTDDDMVDASNIQVQCEGNEVVLTGTVSSREEKRRAEDLVESISGVQNVENRIKVKKSDDDTTRGSSWESERSSGR